MRGAGEAQTSFLPMPTIATLANGATGEDLNSFWKHFFLQVIDETFQLREIRFLYL